VIAVAILKMTDLRIAFLVRDLGELIHLEMGLLHAPAILSAVLNVEGAATRVRGNVHGTNIVMLTSNERV